MDILLKKNIENGNLGRVHFSRLTSKDIPRISRFLMSIWPKLYGEHGHPCFGEDYLSWLFGGPRQQKHLLIGALMKDALVAYHSFLFRTIVYGGKTLNAYIHTHATISPYLASALRMNCVLQMTKQRLLFNTGSQFYDDQCDLVYSFQDVDNSIKIFGEKILRRHFDVQLKIFSVFNQFIVIPHKLRKYINERQDLQNFVNVRPASELESHALTKLFNEHSEDYLFDMQLTENELKHHFFGRQEHYTYVVEEQEELKALINFYPAEIVKDNKTSTYVIVEFLVANSHKREHAAYLLMEAVKFSEKIGSKSVVFENASYLDYRTYMAIGLMPTMRKMEMSVISKNEFNSHSGKFRCDVK